MEFLFGGLDDPDTFDIKQSCTLKQSHLSYLMYKNKADIRLLWKYSKS